MTEKQTAILLMNIQERLGTAILLCERALPDELFEERKNLIGRSYRVCAATRELHNVHQSLLDQVGNVLLADEEES
jgi:hypothetical protein